MKRLLTTLAAMAFAAVAFAQAPTDTFVKGSLSIDYRTRAQPGKEEVTDVYRLDVNVSNSAKLTGTIEHLPYIVNTISDQKGQLRYNVDLDVVNPANPAQTRNVGKLTGSVPVTKENVYQFGTGKATISVFPIGNAKGFESSFKGNAAGKPPAKTGILASAQQAMSFSRTVNGKTVALNVTKYDKMAFDGLVLAAGPVQTYAEATVTGDLFYDYNRSAWYLKDVKVTYPVDGRQMIDTLSGNIRWSEASSSYDFDIRVNEAPPTESSIFAGPSTEADFFASDSAIPALTGTMKYTDSKSGGRVLSSKVAIDLKGNKLTRQQCMYLAKLLLLCSTVPLNAE